MTVSGDSGRITALDQKIDKLGESVSNGFDRLVQALSVKADRHELDNYVRKDAYEERGKRVDNQIESLRVEQDKDDRTNVQQSLVRQGQKYWWVPFLTLALKPELLHSIANALGGK